MKKTFKYLKPFIPMIIIGVVLTFAQSMLSLNLPTLMSDIVNNGIVGQSIDEVLKYGSYMLYVTIGFMVCAIGATFIASKVSAGFANKLRNAVYSKVQKFSLSEYKKISTSSLITRTTNDVTQVQQLTLMSMRMMIQAPLMCIGGIIMALSMNKQLSLLFIVVIPLLLVAIVMLAKKILPLFTSLQKFTDRINQVIREKLTGVRVIRAFGSQAYEGKRYDKANKDIYDVSLKASYRMAILMPVVLFVINVSSVAVVWFGAHLIGDGAMQIGDMMAFMQYAIQVLFSILAVTMLFVMIPRAMVSVKRINEVLGTESSIEDKIELVPNEKFTNPGEIEFINATFQYLDGDEPVLSDMNFKIKKGETVAILGGTGSGKTSLLSLIMRFYDITSGTIKIGGVDIKEIPLEQLRDMMGYVPQKAMLFSGTIESNIKYGKQNATEEEMIRAAKISQSYDFISSLEEQFNAPVSQGGTNFSGGQKQRLSIARAIVKDPAIYLFDDSFSALDFQTDKKLRDALSENVKGATIVIVAQRVSTVLNADKILFIDEGKIIAQGTHKELYNSCEEYKEVVLSQITEEEAINGGK
ncbi:MAG: ABC transporter ATP-binding protein [Clostridia bacterium]|nr:ABC transporter ATP-binding protein [Clostridia bacterium]